MEHLSSREDDESPIAVSKMSTVLMSAAQAALLLGTSAACLSMCKSGNDDSDEETMKSGIGEGGGGEEEPKTPEPPAASSSASAESGSSGEQRSSEGGDSESSRKIEEMTANDPAIKFIIEFKGPATEEFAKQATAVVNGMGVFMWGANKRALANAAAWKDLAKRITTLQAEGFDVQAGSDEAKERRKLQASQKHTKPLLLEQIEGQGKGKKKKKKSKKKHEE